MEADRSSLRPASRQFILTLVMFVVVAVNFGFYVYSERQVDRANAQRFEMFRLADELRQSSDDLTRMVRTYVATRDPAFKRHYQEILDIRDGRVARPRDYHNIYWDLVMADDRRPRPAGRPVALLDLMRRAGLSEAELAKLTEAKANSDALTRIEFAAMALVEGPGEPAGNGRQAYAMLHDAVYHEAKAGIMRPIGEFYRMVDERTLAAVRARLIQARIVMATLVGFALVLVYTLWQAQRTRHVILGGSLDDVRAHIARLAQGDFASPILVPDGRRESVMGWLAETQAKLAELDARRRQAEAALRRERDRAQVYLDTVETMIVALDTNGCITLVNRKGCQALGYPEAELLGRDWFATCLPPGDSGTTAARDYFRSLVAGQAPDTLENAVLSRSGELRQMVWHNALLRDCDGRVVEVLGAGEDVTERKAAEQALRASQQKLMTILENVDACIYLKDTEGRYLFANKPMRELWQVDMEAVIGFGDVKFYDAATAAAIRANDRRVLEAGETIRAEEVDTVPATGRTVVHLSTKLPLRREDGSIYALCGISTDITERKRVEAELKRSNAELEQFAYAISHDMRQPLRMVSSYLQLIERAMKGRLDEDSRQYLAFALDGARRMDAMILALLNYSRVGRKSDPKAPLDVRAALDEALSFLGPELDTGGGTVAVGGDWPELVASRDEIVRLFQNLVGNALRYHEEGSPPRVEVVGQQMAESWRCEVRDQGIGIDPHQAGRLFNVFVRLQPHSRFDGSGVGLALCRKIVEHHGGRIGVESEGEGRGSTFWFELPLTVPPAQTGAETP